jgi:hypothetical protein
MMPSGRSRRTPTPEVQVSVDERELEPSHTAGLQRFCSRTFLIVLVEHPPAFLLIWTRPAVRREPSFRTA